jgi:uncharacterized BrkB/YihY/UPF0761 family membrane protein
VSDSDRHPKEAKGMGEGKNEGARPEGQQAEGRPGMPVVPVVGDVVKKTTRFSREVVATMISLASAAFGVVAALAWNSAITTWFSKAFHTDAAKVSALFLYAVIVTLIGVIVIVLLGRLAARVNAEPVEFKYPGVPKQ